MSWLIRNLSVLTAVFLLALLTACAPELMNLEPE